jgi:dTDP-4-dehydrorhamnose reductase
MTTSKVIVVTGCDGLLGNSLLPVIRERYTVVGMDQRIGSSKTSESVALDLSQEAAIRSIVDVSPSVVIHAAAQTNVDRCEIDRGLATRANVDSTRNVAKACDMAKAKLVLLSTDYVFDGVKGGYIESDPPNPLNFYGMTKLEAERIAATSPNSLIIRSSVLYGWNPNKPNFVTWLLERLGDRKEAHVADDQFNSPTFAGNLALAIREALERNVKGVLHLAGSERISRFDFARKTAEKFNLNAGLLVPVKMKKLNWIAKRPRDSSLVVERAEKELAVELFGVDRGLEEMLRRRT